MISDTDSLRRAELVDEFCKQEGLTYHSKFMLGVVMTVQEYVINSQENEPFDLWSEDKILNMALNGHL